ncbi:hypothetical protein EX30DRAFT_370766 [Ascodesmis nigricans]|uniref:Uncharacterized protein n=1 Tax=Ascodesmis nigricans TaxID=341454 RepID=A0A4S2MZS2_9PEZI|nr:hypothetical protein EX30DRAFT_370766 [Ascodesmis nigricans]
MWLGAVASTRNTPKLSEEQTSSSPKETPPPHRNTLTGYPNPTPPKQPYNMFGAPPPPSPAEVRAQEIAAKSALQYTLSTCFVLYLSPFVVDYVRKLI